MHVSRQEARGGGRSTRCRYRVHGSPSLPTFTRYTSPTYLMLSASLILWSDRLWMSAWINEIYYRELALCGMSSRSPQGSKTEADLITDTEVGAVKFHNPAKWAQLFDTHVTGDERWFILDFHIKLFCGFMEMRLETCSFE